MKPLKISHYHFHLPLPLSFPPPKAPKIPSSSSVLPLPSYGPTPAPAGSCLLRFCLNLFPMPASFSSSPPASNTDPCSLQPLLRFSLNLFPQELIWSSSTCSRGSRGVSRVSCLLLCVDEVSIFFFSWFFFLPCLWCVVCLPPFFGVDFLIKMDPLVHGIQWVCHKNSYHTFLKVWPWASFLMLAVNFQQCRVFQGP